MFLNHEEKDLKIIDFGVGTSFKDNTKTTLKVGSVFSSSFRSITLLQKLSGKNTTINVTSGLSESYSISYSLEDRHLQEQLIKKFIDKY